MLSKDEASQCFHDPLYMPPGPWRDIAYERERKQAEAVRKAGGPIISAFKDGASVRKLARRFRKTEAEIEAKIRGRLL